MGKFGRFLAALAVIGGLVPAAASATYLGENGKIAFNRYDPATDTGGIWAINPDGTGLAQLTQGDSPAWSADGRKLAYGCPSPDDYSICTANADGSSAKVLDNLDLYPQDSPTWSPDGTKLAVQSANLCGSGCGYSDIWRVNSDDGSDQIRIIANGASPNWSQNRVIAYSYYYAFYQYPPAEIRVVHSQYPGSSTGLTDADGGGWPDWSPDGTKIVFASYRDSNYEIYVMNDDGTNQTRLTNDSDYESEPVWSPDGTKILFVRAIGTEYDLWTMNPDGSGQARLTDTPGVTETSPAWQPVPQPGYPRPKGATPLRVSLVPAFERCETPNEVHGPALTFGSCAPPQQRGGYAVFGAPSATQASGSVRLDVIPGAPGSQDEADVAISVRLADVRRRFDGADALGSLDFPLPLRLTDKNSGAYDSEQATVEDFGTGVIGYTNNPLRVEVPCVETADPGVGSTCSVSTTADVIVPGRPGEILPFVTEGARAIWQLDQIAVYDGGEDGYIDSRDDNTVLAVQGVFVP